MADPRVLGSLSFMPQAPLGTTQPRILGGLTATGDTGESELDRLIASLEVQAPTPPPKLSPGRTALGIIGDALLAAGRVRSGGQAPDMGPFASLLINRHQAFESATAEAAAANRDLRNRIRIGEFGAKRTEEAEIRKEGRIRAAETAEAEIKAKAEQEKERIKIEGDVRKGFIDKILELGIDTQGRDLLTTSTAGLKEIIDAADPSASITTILQHLPPNMELSQVHIDKDGKLSFDIGKKGKGKEIPAGIITALISAGEDPSPFIEDPTLGAAARKAAEANKTKLLDTQADTFLEDVQKTAKANIVGPDGDTIDVVNQAISAAAMDVRALGKSQAAAEQVARYYQQEVSDVADNVKNNEPGWSEQAATDYVLRLRQLIKVRFGSAPFDVIQAEKEKRAAQAGSELLRPPP